MNVLENKMNKKGRRVNKRGKAQQNTAWIQKKARNSIAKQTCELQIIENYEVIRN